MTWESLQKNIADRYCGTVLVLDDDVYERKQPGRKAKEPFVVQTAFSQTKAAFQARGALCDLWHIEDQFKKVSTRKPVIEALKRCDTLILDWYLGRGMVDPSNAIEVLKELVSLPGFRFAVIHTKEQPESVLQTLRREFLGSFVDLASERNVVLNSDDEVGDESIVVENADSGRNLADLERPSTYRLGANVYLCIIQKGDIPGSAKHLVDVFYEQLVSVFKDHIHWAGFEFAAKVKAVLPQLLQNLPSDTDRAVAFQSLLLEENELEECVIETLTAELGCLMQQMGVKAVKDETVLRRVIAGAYQNRQIVKARFPSFSRPMASKWKQMSVAQAKVKCIEKSIQRDGGVIRAYEDAFFDAFPSDAKKKHRGGLQEHKSEISDFIALSLGHDLSTETSADSHLRYGALREHLQSAKPSRLRPGVILRRKEGVTDGDEWLVCVTPACDCARGSNKRDYLFVGGMRMDGPGRSRAGTMQSCLRDGNNACHRVKWTSKRLQTRKLKPSDPGDGYEFFGEMHRDFTQCLIHSVWGHETRVGVSTSDYLRKERE